MEALVAHRELLTLKKAGELLTPVFPSAARRREVQELIMRVATSTDREAVIAEIHAAGKPVYATDRRHPGLVVEVAPDGTRRVGRLEGRRFLPAEDRPPGKAR